MIKTSWIRLAGFAVLAAGSFAMLMSNFAVASVGFRPDFLSQTAGPEIGQIAVVEQAETLHDWQFTGRDRPPKCRFGR